MPQLAIAGPVLPLPMRRHPVHPNPNAGAPPPLPPSRSDADKESEIAGMARKGTARPMRVGPAAAKQLLQLLRSSDPNLRISKKAAEEAG